MEIEINGAEMLKILFKEQEFELLLLSKGEQ